MRKLRKAKGGGGTLMLLYRCLPDTNVRGGFGNTKNDNKHMTQESTTVGQYHFLRDSSAAVSFTFLWKDCTREQICMINSSFGRISSL